MSEVKTIPAVGKLGPTAAQLVEKLKDGKAGDTLTDEQLAAICGKATGPNQPGYSSLQSAISHVRSNHGLTWQRLPKANAIRCLNAEETVESVTGDLRSIKKKSRRAASKLRTVDPSKIKDDSTRHKVTVLGAMMGALQVMAAGATVAKLEVRAHELSTPDAGKVLGLFVKG